MLGYLALSRLKIVGMMWLAGLFLDQAYVNLCLTDNTHVTHRACFDFLDFLLTFWKILTGVFSGALRMGGIALVGVYYALRVDVPVFRDSRALLDPGYNAFVSLIMVHERQNNPALQASSA